MFRIPLILLAAVACFASYLPQDVTPPEEIVIDYVEVSIHTKKATECDAFETVFKKKKKTKKIDSPGDRTRFVRELNSLEKRVEKFAFSARAQITITTESGTEVICADHLSVYRNGECYAITPLIRTTIWKQT